MQLNDKYMKIIECLGEVLISRDEKILFKDYEIEALRNKVNEMKQRHKETFDTFR